MLEAILGSIRPNVEVHSLSILISSLTSLSLKSTNEIIANSASRLLASILNKSNNKDAHDLLDAVTSQVFENINNDTISLPIKFNSTKLLNWIMKGIILRGIPSLEEWIMKWFDLLNRDDIGGCVAEGFGIVIAEDDILNLDNHCTIK